MKEKSVHTSRAEAENAPLIDTPVIVGPSNHAHAFIKGTNSTSKKGIKVDLWS